MSAVTLDSVCIALPPGQSRNFIIYCAPGLSEEAKKEISEQIQYFIAGGSGASNQPRWGMKPGDTLRLIDGKNLVQIGETLKIPDNARTAVLQLKSGTGMVKSFLKFLEKDSSLSPKQSAITPGSNLNIPKICSDEVPEANANILLIGSPLYHDDVEAHDMRYGWLGDGYFSDAEWPLDLVGAFGSQLRGRVDPSGPHFPA